MSARHFVPAAVVAALCVACSPGSAHATEGDDAEFLGKLPPAVVATHDADELTLSGQDLCTALESGEGLINATHNLMLRGFTGPEAMAISKAASQVYCPDT